MVINISKLLQAPINRYSGSGWLCVTIPTRLTHVPSLMRWRLRYSVLDLQTVAPDVTSGEYFRMVEIRNPHGQGEWQGAQNSEWIANTESASMFQDVRRSAKPYQKEKK